MTTSIIGDLHGHIDAYKRLLTDSALCDADQNWSGGSTHLWLMGDFFDRGPAGVACVDLTMKLQRQAAAAGGRVESLTGNHEAMIITAYRHGNARNTHGMRFKDQWRAWGGIDADFCDLTPRHVDWLSERPVMALEGSTLLMHADALMYADYGFDVAAVNERVQRILGTGGPGEAQRLLTGFAQHMAFQRQMTSTRLVDQFLGVFGATGLVHGHTPIPVVTGTKPEAVDGALAYADGRCVNVDGGIYLGGPGFVFALCADD
jgi:hypothetical protein